VLAYLPDGVRLRRGGSRAYLRLGQGGSTLGHRRRVGYRPGGSRVVGRGVTSQVHGGTPRSKQRCRDRGTSRGPAQPRPPGSNRRLWCRSARRLREAELGRPEADAAVTAGGDVEVGSPVGLELAGGGPRLPTGAELFERGADPLVGPVTLPGRAGLPDEPIRGCAPPADPLEDPGIDQVCEIDSRLRAADARDLLVLSASQPTRPIPGERSENALLRGFKPTPILGSLRHSPPLRGHRGPTIAHDPSS